jgi:hypothetical protein
MKKIFQEIKDQKCDAITFLPRQGQLLDTEIHGLTYHDKGIKAKGTDIGDLFDITIFRRKDNKYCDIERFDAILACPYTYSSTMFDGNYYGIVAKKTSTSDNVINSFEKRITKLLKL